ncbi:MAG: hypothetical protein ISS70_23760 [Phycisphaerae bacterium]|nr:hypothetical protein [Phycisphaerae bacterium]
MNTNLPVSPNVVGEQLESVAKRGAQIYYSQLVEQFGLPPLDGAWSSHPLAEIFEVLDQQDATANRPFRTSVVVAVETNRPGNGLYEALERLKGVPDPGTPSAREAIWIREMQAAHDYNWP